MKEFVADILIVGAGLTGLMTAFTLSSLKKKIIIVDKSNFLLPSTKITDFRTTAISEGSKLFLENIGFWGKIKTHAEPIRFINVIDRDKKTKIKFFNSKKSEFLGYIVKNSILKDFLIKQLSKQQNITLISGKKIEKISNSDNHAISYFENLIIKSQLLIAADGKKSTVRDILKTKLFKKTYAHHAAVINIEHTKNHFNIAYELFYKTGPLAILPATNKKKSLFSSSIIWSNPIDYSNNLQKINTNLLKMILQEKIFNFTGEVKNILNTQFFPLSAHLNIKFYEDRVVYVGDSAHSIHPIAGQGWNLGIRDIKNLLLIVGKYNRLGIDLGNINICKEYHDKTFYDSHNMYQVTDKLNSIFMNETKLVKLLRGSGFNLIENNDFIKKNISNFAMGF